MIKTNFNRRNYTTIKVLPRTIRKEQDVKLHEVADETGRKISELVRDVVKIKA